MSAVEKGIRYLSEKGWSKVWLFKIYKAGEHKDLFAPEIYEFREALEIVAKEAKKEVFDAFETDPRVWTTEHKGTNRMINMAYEDYELFKKKQRVSEDDKSIPNKESK